MRMLPKPLGAELLLVLTALGCSDSDDPPPTRDAGGEAGAALTVDAGSPESGIDPAIRLLDLSSDQAKRVCSAWSTRLDRLVPHSTYLQASCTQQAWPLSADAAFMPSPSRCNELLAMCVANDGALGGFPPAQSLGADLVDPTRCVQPSAGLDLGPCDATVGDLEVCTAALAVAVADHIKLITCDALLDSAVLDRVARDVDLTMVPECHGLQMRCPALLFYSGLDGKPPP
ncbi:MAG TPA: hypothetical protein VFN67_42420 [Polyangiales bacterium]|nr:hypothetical protein [Polyangiales bacterium]